jgi:RHS repeat-associated protein
VTLAGFSYDAAGNETTDVTNTYVWNAESEIKTTGGLNYSYDGDGDRVQKSNGKIYWYGAGSEILDESDAAGNITDEYVYFGGKRIAHRVVSGNSVYYYAEDMLGSSRALATSAGAVCYDADFFPYGGEHDYVNSCPQNYKFTGKERDPETNNDDFDARYYSSAYGRFLSADWSSTPSPVPYANLTNPQTLNLYAMVSDNPESFADLDGHVNPAQGPPVNCTTGIQQTCDAKAKADAAASAEAQAKAVAAAALEKAKAAAQAIEKAYAAEQKWMKDHPDVAAVLMMVAAVVSRGESEEGAIGEPEVEPSSPTGRSGNPMEVEPGTNAPGSVNGRDYTGHAFDQIQGRGITPSAVENTIQTGTPSEGNIPGTRVYYDRVNNLTAVTDSGSGRVIITSKSADY